MCGRTFDAISVVYASFSGFVVDVKVLEVVVEIDAARTEVAAEESGVSREHGRDINVSLPTERDGDPGLPLVKVGNDGGGELPRDILSARTGEQNETDDDGSLTSPRNQATTYPKRIASLVSVSLGGEGIPARFQRSPFHSSRRWNALPVSNSSTRGAPSISQRP